MIGQRFWSKTLPVALGLALGAMWLAPLRAAPGPAEVRSIRVSESGGDTSIVIAASKRPTFTTWKLEQPARVVVDVSGARLGDVDVPLDAGTYAVGMVTASVSEDEASGPHTRVVLTLRQAADYQVEARGTEIVLRVQPRVRPAAASAAAPAEARAASQAEAEKLKRQLDDARKEAEKARAAASVAAAEAERDKAAVARSDAEAKKAQGEADQARRRAEAAEQESRAAQSQAAERSRALEAAAREIDGRNKALEANSKNQEAQRSRLEEAERVVQAREAKLRAAAAEQAAIEERSRQSRVRQGELDDAASKARVRAVAAEEASLAEARAARAKLEAERAKLEAERAQLEQARNVLAAEVKRLKEAAAIPVAKVAVVPVAKPVAVAKVAAAPAARITEKLVAPARAQVPDAGPATQTLVIVRAQPDAKPTGKRPRSVTLHVPSQVRSVDFVDEPTRSSVIIGLDEPSDFSVERTAGGRLSLRLDHADLPEALERNLDATEYLGPVRLISTYRDPSLRGAVRVDVDLAEDVPNRVRREGNRIFWDFHKPADKAPSLPALRFPPPTVEFVAARRVAGFSVSNPLGWMVAQSQTLTRKGGADAAGEGAAKAPRSVKKRYVGRRIDLDFKGADIHNILRLLSDVGQINIVTSDEVRGEVTIKMRDVPWDQAMDVVLRAKGLGSVREGNLLRVAPLSVLEKELEQEIQRQKSMQEVLPTETRLIGVSYATASSMQDKARDLLSPRGKISVDDRTNNLIVSDVTRNLQLVEDLVRNLDTQTSQVVIEARIVEARSTFARKLGIQWGGNAFADVAHGNPTGLVFPYNVGVGGGADDGSSPLSGLVPSVRTGNPLNTQNPNFLVNMPAPAGLGTGTAIGLTMGSVAGAFNLNLRLSAMESGGQVRILSSPRITTMDNVQANITQGVSIPISVVSAMGAQTQFVDAKLDLSVKPHVTNEGTVTLDINVTRNEPDFVNTGSRGDPTILRKEAKTQMLVRDGDTAVIGGIYTRNSGVSHGRIPYFSDIPVLGWLFRNRSENDDRTEFLVFITPRIVNRARSLGQ